jgi:SRSO17 transposase
MQWDAKLWKDSVDQFIGFITPLTARVGRSERRVAATRYVEGLLIPGQRKSIEPMAQRLGVDSQSLQQFVTDSPWSDDALWSAIRREVIPHLEPLEAWVVDETGWLKQGRHSVGVSHQYCGAVGKSANCQVSVEVAVSDGWVAAPVAGRLYLPENWTSDPSRCEQAGVPDHIRFATKPMIAAQLVEQTLLDGVPLAPILGDAVYGDNAQFRRRLRELGLEFFLQIDPGKHKGWDHPVDTVLKKSRRHVDPQAPSSQTLKELTASIPVQQWKDCSWVTAGGQTRTTRLAWKEVFLQHNLRHADGDLERLWLVVDWPAGDPEPYHCYLAHFSQSPTKAHCLKLSRSRWHIEQYFQRSKDDLGLDHYEGRSWRGFHHHLVLSAIAYLFILIVYLRNKKNFWCDVGTDSPHDPAIDREMDRMLHLLRKKI